MAKKYQPVRKSSLGDFTTGPGECLVIFDVIFFFNYALGWLLTYIFNPEAIDDNNVTRVFRVYNICIGVDSLPARPICACIFSIAFVFYAAAVYCHYVKLHYDKTMPKLVGCPLLILAFVLGSTFSLTFAVAPEGELNTKIHVLSFATGLVGYLSMKVYAILEFYSFGFGRSQMKHQLYVWSLILQVLFMGFMCYALISTLVLLEIGPLIAGPVPEGIRQDATGSVLVFLAMVGPPIQHCFAPLELRDTATIGDATPNDPQLSS